MMCSVATHVKFSICFNPSGCPRSIFLLDTPSTRWQPHQKHNGGLRYHDARRVHSLKKRRSGLRTTLDTLPTRKNSSADVHKRNGAAKAQFTQRITLVPLSTGASPSVRRASAMAADTCGGSGTTGAANGRAEVAPLPSLLQHPHQQRFDQVEKMSVSEESASSSAIGQDILGPGDWPAAIFARLRGPAWTDVQLHDLPSLRRVASEKATAAQPCQDSSAATQPVGTTGWKRWQELSTYSTLPINGSTRCALGRTARTTESPVKPSTNAMNEKH